MANSTTSLHQPSVMLCHQTARPSGDNVDSPPRTLHRGSSGLIATFAALWLTIGFIAGCSGNESSPNQNSPSDFAGSGGSSPDSSGGSAGSSGEIVATGGTHSAEGGSSSTSDFPPPAELGEQCYEDSCADGLVCAFATCDLESECPWVCQTTVADCSQTPCPDDQYCAEVTTADGLFYYCTPIAHEGQQCDGSMQSCFEGSECVMDYGAGISVCLKRPEKGDPCDSNGAQCVDGTYCDGNVQKCLKSIGLNQICQLTYQCETGLFCDPNKHLCKALHSAGEECTPNAINCSNGECGIFSEQCLPELQCLPSGNVGGCFTWDDCGGDTCCADSNNKGYCSPPSGCDAPKGVCTLVQ